MASQPLLPTTGNTIDRPNLDVLRSYAVLLVVLDHTWLARGIFRLPLGWNPAWIGVVGVFIFFVHTSLVLMWSLERKPHTLDFYIRRIFRIYPLVFVAIFAVLLFHAPVGGTPTHFFQFPHTTHQTIITNLLLFQNLTHEPNLMGVLWSLPLEVQMYLLLPFLYAFLHREPAFWPILLLWAFVCLLNRVSFPADSIIFFSAIPCFLPGVLAFVGYARFRPRLPGLLLLPVTLLLTAAFMVRPSPRRGWFFCLALGLLLPFFRELAPSWFTRAAHHVAKYSFGIYLFHSFALVLAFYLHPTLPTPVQFAIELVAILLFSVLGYHLVELPFIRLGKRIAARAESLYERRSPLPAQPL